MKTNQMDGAKTTIRAIEAIAEVAILTCLYYFIWRGMYAEGTFYPYYGKGKFVLGGIYAVLIFVLFRSFDGFKFGYLRLSEIIVAQWIAVFLTNFITWLQLCLMANQVVTPVPLLLLMAVEAVFIFVYAYFCSKLYQKMYAPKNMIMVIGSENAIYLKFKMDTRQDKYRIQKLISVNEGLEEICKQISNYEAVVLNDVQAEIRNDIVKFCYANQIRVYLVPKISDILVRGGTDICLFDTPLLLVRNSNLTVTQKIVKRLMDIVLCLMVAIVAAPVMLIVAIAIKLEDGGPVFYKQERVTLGGKTFNILKFRSMIVNAEKNGKAQLATEHDPRITKVGRFIRATRLDELPQLINILKGDMSIVGPRPERMELVQKYAQEIPEFPYRLKVKGGLTGYAQIYGKYNTSAYDKLRLDLMYIENYSLLLDIKLILLTIRIMLKKESTEGVDKVQELELKKQEILADMDADSSKEDYAGVRK